jgi:hypothetical protein
MSFLVTGTHNNVPYLFDSDDICDFVSKNDLTEGQMKEIADILAANLELPDVSDAGVVAIEEGNFNDSFFDMQDELTERYRFIVTAPSTDEPVFIPTKYRFTRTMIVGWINDLLELSDEDKLMADDHRLTDEKCQAFVDKMAEDDNFRDMDPEYEGGLMEDRTDYAREFYNNL